MRLFFLLLFLLPGSHLLHAEDGAKPLKLPPRQMQVLTVGEAPPFRQEIRDGVRVQLPAPPGSLPPVVLDVTMVPEKGKEKDLGSLRLRIGSISAPVTVPGGGVSLLLRLPDTGEDQEAWHRFQCPESGDFIVVMWRDRKINSWDKPGAYVMSADLPAGQVSLINVAPGPVAVVFEAERIALPPQRPQMRPLKPGKPLGFQVGLPKGNSVQRLVSRSLEQQPGQHSIVVLYRADGEKPRSPLGIKVIRLNSEESGG